MAATTTHFTGKVAIVTGASTGIGRAVALRLVRDGAKVAVGYNSGSDRAEKVVQQIGADKAVAIQADTSKLADVERLVSETMSTFKRIDILVPCGGLMPVGHLDSVTENDFDKTFSVNVKGPILLTQAAAPHMKEGGNVVLFSTTLTAASTVPPHYLLYVSSKAAVEQATKILAKTLAKRNIKVNCVAPGPTATDGFMANQSEGSLKMAAGFNPNLRIGEPEEIADAVAFLCHHDSRWVQGQTLRVNGGMA